ncbi:hypothetical protein ACQ4PT_037238 [Festuca glaucescens]
METAVPPSCSAEQAAASDCEDDAQKASSPRPFVGSDNGDTGIETARASSPESEVVDNGAAADGREAELKNAVVDVADKRDAEETVVQCPDAEAKLGNGEITSDSEIEPTYVLINKKVVEAKAARGSDALGTGSDAGPQLEDKNVGNAVADLQATTTAADAAMATTANAEESYDELSSFTGTGRSDRGSARNSSPSCSSRAQSVERLLEADAALVRKKCEDPGVGGRRSAQTVSTPPSARSRGTTTSPRGTGLGFKKRFLSFGKKTRARMGLPSSSARLRRRCWPRRLIVAAREGDVGPPTIQSNPGWSAIPRMQLPPMTLTSPSLPGEAEEDGEKRRSSEVAAPGRVSGKKHARTRKSFSSVNLVKSSRPDVGLRRALSQEPLPPTSAVAEGANKKHGAPIGAAATKRKALCGSKGGSVKGHGSVRQASPKPPRGALPRRCGSGGMETAVPPSCSAEQAAASDCEDDAQKASSPRPFIGSDTGIETARASSPESEVVDNGAVADGREAELKNAVFDVADKRDAEETVVQCPDADAKLGNGEITSDSEIEPSYVVIKKMVVEGNAADLQIEDKNIGNAVADLQATTAADAATATTANAEESYDELSSFTGTGRSYRGSARNSSPSCSSRAQSVERLLEADAALVRKKREDPGVGGRRSAQTVSTPPSARSRGTTTSPRGTGLGFNKRFLSFGKKTRGKDDLGATVIECTSPASVPASPADCGSTRRRCRTADDSIRPRVVGLSSDTAASDDTDHAASPRGNFHVTILHFHLRDRFIP